MSLCLSVFVCFVCDVRCACVCFMRSCGLFVLRCVLLSGVVCDVLFMFCVVCARVVLV